MCVCLVPQSCLLFATPWTVAHQTPLSMGFSRQEYWSGLPCPPPGDLPNPGLIYFLFFCLLVPPLLLFLFSHLLLSRVNKPLALGLDNFEKQSELKNQFNDMFL